MDPAHPGGHTLKSTLCQDFAAENGTTGIDCTAMKARWISKASPQKTTGSLVIWLKEKAAAEYLLQSGTAIFGATGAYCARWETREESWPCFHCNQYGHKQSACTGTVACALCAGRHRRTNCPQSDKPSCPTCKQPGHTVFAWECKLHPNHWKHEGKMKAAQRVPGAATVTAAATAAAPAIAAAPAPLRQQHPP